jgi:hypothetical protein
MRVGDSWRKLASNDLAVLVLWEQPESFCIPLPTANMVSIGTKWLRSMTHAQWIGAMSPVRQSLPFLHESHSFCLNRR